MDWIPTWKELISFTDEQLIEQFDKRFSDAKKLIQAEIFYRQQSKISERIEKATITMKRLTWAIAILTIANLIFILFRR